MFFIVIGSNNAGVMATPFSLSQDGIELQFATNHVGMSSDALAILRFLYTLAEAFKKKIMATKYMGIFYSLPKKNNSAFYISFFEKEAL